jgi:beta-mannosidase
MIRTELNDGWTVRATNSARLTGEFTAAVPGSVHIDLLAAGVIPDPFLDAGEAALTWLFDLDWRYRTVLDAAPPANGERIDLVFDGLDTIATVTVGGTEIGRTFNMHRSYRFDVTSLTAQGHAELAVDLASATDFAERERDRLGNRPAAYSAPFNFVRKMACSFGWDWGPDLRTAGIWKRVRVERWHIARLAQVRPLIGVDAGGTGQVEITVELERTGIPQRLTVTASVLGASASATVEADQDRTTLRLAVPDAPLWWPVGYGDQPLAELVVDLSQPGEREPLDSWSRRIGFRTVQLDRSADGHGTRFTIAVNGRPVFVKGANWIPDDHFLTRVGRERLGRRLDQAVQANLNLLRVWGGGVYESEDFYELCDERGLLVWQDFLLACAAYPEEPPLWQEIEAEARENVVRLMPHPALVLWNGGNENVWGHEDWGWKEKLDGLSWGGRYASELLRDVVAELDPSRPYSDNSPYSPGFPVDQVHPNDPDHGTHHQWEVWNRVDYAQYRSEIPRFCSEFGFQAPPTWSTLTDWVHAQDGGPLTDAPDPRNDPVFLLHQKAEDGNGKLERGLAGHVAVPTDFVDWHWATQLNQARAVTYAIEHYRSWSPRTAGAIVWQLNDCWPVTSWAAIDFEERPKPVWYALQRAFAPRLLAILERDGELVVVAANDTDQPWTGELALRRETLDGRPLVRSVVAVDVRPRDVALIGLQPELRTPGDPAAELLVGRLGDVQVVHPFAEDVGLDLDPQPLDTKVNATRTGYDVSVTARSFARDVTLLVDRLDPAATVDRALVSLPAGETVTFTVTSQVTGLSGRLAGPPVLRSANDLRPARTEQEES